MRHTGVPAKTKMADCSKALTENATIGFKSRKNHQNVDGRWMDRSWGFGEVNSVSQSNLYPFFTFSKTLN